jgi:hypothetical protein
MAVPDPALDATPGEAPPPYVPPPPEGPRKTLLRRLPLPSAVPLAGAWLARPDGNIGIGLFYGLCFWAMGLTLAAVFRARPEYVMSIASGCLLVGPFLAMGLYDVSRRRERVRRRSCPPR